MKEDHPLQGFTARLVGDTSADPSELFDHYDAFAACLSRVLAAKSNRLRILDLGSPKMMTAMLAGPHDVTSMVLKDCGDHVSNVRYVVHDVAAPLPFADSSFDFFTSTATLQLIGLARYGDALDAYCLPRFLKELRRVTTRRAECMISLCLGHNHLAFNNSWFLDFHTITTLLSGWTVENVLVDEWSSPRSSSIGKARERFSKNTSVARLARGDYRVVIIYCRRTRIDQVTAAVDDDE
jgi:hypothetical protein